VSVEPEGRWCLAANYETGSVCDLPVREDGWLGEASVIIQFSGGGPDAARQEGPHAPKVVPGLDSGTVLAIDLGADRLMAFDLDRDRGSFYPRN